MVLIVVLITGAVWQRCMLKKEASTYTPVGTMVTVNSHDMHVYVKGTGITSYVFLAGSGTPSSYTDFYQLQNEFSQYGKTISYDHDGFGWSDATSESHTVDRLAEELSVILDTVKAGENCILVCHSLASLEAIRFAQLYPEKVNGIVFLDSGSPEFYSKDSEITSILINRACAVGRVTGLNRLLVNIGVSLPFVGESARIAGLPEEVRKIERAMYNRYLGNNKNLDLLTWINENAFSVLEGERLTNLPILVLSSESGTKWEEVQKELCAWSKVGKQSTLEGAGHYIHWTNQKEVIEAIHQFIKEYKL